jgi:hypothetical protein
VVVVCQIPESEVLRLEEEEKEKEEKEEKEEKVEKVEAVRLSR